LQSDHLRQLHRGGSASETDGESTQSTPCVTPGKCNHACFCQSLLALPFFKLNIHFCFPIQHPLTCYSFVPFFTRGSKHARWRVVTVGFAIKHSLLCTSHFCVLLSFFIYQEEQARPVALCHCRVR
jgi:hypothetical protein